MIAIVSSSLRERAALASLCESRRWPCAECDSLRALKKLIRHTQVRVVLTRQRLSDGYSDDAIALLAKARLLPSTKILVLLPSGTIPAVEARQVKLGADYVQRDPVRMEVLLEYLAKYLRAPASEVPAAQPAKEKILRFAGGRVLLVDRQWRHGKRVTKITPREIDLIEVLMQSEGHAVSYHNLFSDIIGRRFRGDTANLRVLLGLLDASARRIGIPLRRWVEVIPKLGYRYRRPLTVVRAKAKTQKTRRPLSAAA